MHNGIFRARQSAVLLFFIASLSILSLRLFYIQVVQYGFYSKLAGQQHTVSIEINPKRGAIFDRNMRVLAVNLMSDSVFANARVVENKRAAANALSRALGLTEEFVHERLTRNKAFVWIKRKVTSSESAAVKNLKIPGIDTVQESQRFYPNRSMACHSIGTVDIDNIGLEGLELKYNKYLAGENGWLVSTQDAKRNLLESYQAEYVPPKDGFSLVLTIDEVIQHIAERELARAFEKHNAKGASIVVMDPRSGDILALANLPAYDLNDFKNRRQESIRNRAVTDFFEPGSVFKVITASALLEENLVRLTDQFFCENGEWRIGRRVLHDHTPHGLMTFKEVIEKSSNIGTVKAAARLGPDKMYKFIKAFGFTELTGIDLPGEVAGINRPPSRWSGVSMNAIPMGQEVTSTAIQLACAVTAVSNNGYLLKPRVVSAIIGPDGQVLKEFSPKVSRRVVSAATAAKVRSILVGVTEAGTGKKAKPADFRVGGKTGTAQKVEPGSGVYSPDKFVASFIGFAPAEAPVLAVAVCVDEPRPAHFGGDVSAPVFRNVVDQSLKYLNAKGAHVN